MEQLKNYGDDRMLYGCVHCGGETGTRDHIPPKVFLDEPYPENLPVVPACPTCNHQASLDEEYLACLIEYAVSGMDITKVRNKIQRILTRKPALLTRLRRIQKTLYGKKYLMCEGKRMEKIIMKLARGHAAYELNDSQIGEPFSISFRPICTLTNEEKLNFNKTPSVSIFPEVGSRAFQRITEDKDIKSGWVIVQSGKYRYLTHTTNQEIIIRIVLGEYMACEVIWNHL